jgi:5-methylcytosine-specific restriction endonuclease McrA
VKKFGDCSDPRRKYWVKRYDLTKCQRRMLTSRLLDQLEACKSVEAQRLILGVNVIGTESFSTPYHRYTSHACTEESQLKEPSRKEKGLIRERIYERALEACEHCGRWVRLTAGEWDSMHLSHNRSKGAGGGWEDSNLQCLCINCHLVGVHNPKSVPSKV